MKKLAVLLLLCLIPSTAYAGYKEVFNAHTGRLDKVGVNASTDMAITCTSGDVMIVGSTGAWSCAQAPGATGGEANTASNVGGGLSNYDSKAGVDLKFNTFKATDFDLAANLLSLDYTNGQMATTAQNGFMRSSHVQSIDNLIVATQDAVIAAGDCTGGACLDGTSDGGTYIDFYDAQGAGRLITGNITAARTWTTPDATGTLALTANKLSAFAATTSAELSGVLSDEDGSGTCGAGVYCLGGHTHPTTEVSGVNAGTDLTADLEEEVTEGSLADSVIVSADIKDATIAGGDLAGNIAITSTGSQDYGGGSFEVPNSTSLPGTCTVGQVYMDTDATSGQRIYACESANTWALQGDGGAGGGDSVSVDGGAVVDPNFASTGQIDFVNTSNTVTADINADAIVESDLKAVDASSDEDVLTYESTTGDFEWHSRDEIVGGMSAGALPNDSILEADLKAVDAASDEECLTYETTTGDFEWQACGSGTDTNAVKEYIWPASATLPLEAAESVPPITKDAGTNIDQLAVAFDDSTDECRTVNFQVPSDVASGNVTFRVKWYSAAATSGSAMWDFRHNGGVAEGTDPDQSLTIELAASDATQGTAGQITVTAWTETIANLGWSASEQVDAVFCRDANGTGGTDDLSGDALATQFAVEILRA